jgi:hypothetical protein
VIGDVEWALPTAFVTNGGQGPPYHYPLGRRQVMTSPPDRKLDYAPAPHVEDRYGLRRGARLAILFMGLCVLGFFAWMLIMRRYPE